MLLAELQFGKSRTSAAEAGAENKPFIAALQALRHPKPSSRLSFPASCEVVPFSKDRCETGSNH
jgi:hypothetical protein